jgi:hypothetical protein
LTYTGSRRKSTSTQDDPKTPTVMKKKKKIEQVLFHAFKPSIYMDGHP